jgi:HEAT repeat protein
MGGISLKFVYKMGIALCIALVVVYVSIHYHQGSKGKISSKEPSTTNKVEKAAISPGKEDSKTIASAKSSEGEDQEDSWTESVLKALNDPNLKVRVRAVRSLRQHASSPEAVDILRKFLKDKDPVVLREVIDTLGYIGLQGDLEDVVFDLLAQEAMDKSFSRRGDCLTMAAIIGKERLLPTVTDFFREGKNNESMKGFAVRALTFIDSPDCIPLLEEVLSMGAEDPMVHEIAFENLARLGTTEALAILKDHVVSSKGMDQVNSSLALARLDMEEFNQVLANALVKETMEEETIEVLATSPAAPEIFGEVLRVTSDKERKIAWLRKLATYGASGTEEVRGKLTDTVIPLVHSTDPDIQVEAINVVGQTGGEDAAENLIEELDSDNPIVRQAALRALMPYATQENYKELLPRLSDEDKYIRRTVLIVVERFLNESDRPILEAATKNPDEVVRKQVNTILNLMDIDKADEEDKGSS